MLFKDEYNVSLPQKTVFSGCVLFTILAAIYLMFADSLDFLGWLNANAEVGNPIRRTLIASGLVIYYVRLQFTVWAFQKRKWTWLETAIISIVLVVALYAFARVGGSNETPVGFVDFIGVSLYLFGSFINTHSEYSRHTWKSKEENYGKLYTGGLFRYSMHVNYFGDVLLFSGFAMITHTLSMFVIPLIMTVNFIVNIIPSLDKYLESKYGDSFRAYAGRTKKLIPFVY